MMFLDIEGYTRITEQLRAVRVNELVERYFSVFMDAIYSNNGDVLENFGWRPPGGLPVPGRKRNATGAVERRPHDPRTDRKGEPGVPGPISTARHQHRRHIGACHCWGQQVRELHGCPLGLRHPRHDREPGSKNLQPMQGEERSWRAGKPRKGWGIVSRL